MLQLFKNQVVTSVAKQQVEIRQLELDWYTNNYWTLSQQGKLLGKPSDPERGATRAALVPCIRR